MLIRDGLVVKQVRQLSLVHPYSGVGHTDLNVFLGTQSLDTHLAAIGCKLAGIVGKGIDHKQGERLVGLHHHVGVGHLQSNTLERKTHFPFGHNVKKRLQGETLDTQIELSLTDSDPVGQHVVVFVDLIGQFGDISKTLRLALFIVFLT